MPLGACPCLPRDGLPRGRRARRTDENRYNGILGGVIRVAKPTASMEDYLETIYELIQDKGYARVTDIASALDLQPSTVTRMIQRLDEQKFVIYERYRGLALTSKGEAIGQAMRRRHRTLEVFLRLLGVEDEAVVQKDVEGIEHHVSMGTMDCIRYFVELATEDPAWLERLTRYRRERERQKDREEDAGDADSDGADTDY